MLEKRVREREIKDAYETAGTEKSAHWVHKGCPENTQPHTPLFVIVRG